jgi:alpha-2-macroglobulin
MWEGLMKTRASAAFLLFFLIPLLSVPLPANGADGPSVELFSPRGVVRGVRQATARFSDPMVAFGDFRAGSPFDIKCPQKATGRWADSRNWVYDFDHNLPAGIVCGFSLKPDIRTLSGMPLTGEKVFTFSTGGPAVIKSYPREGQTVAEDQIFILYTDAEPSEQSVLAHAWCSIEDINERVEVRLLKGAEKEKIIKLLNYGNPPTKYTTVLQCRRNFPGDKTVKLIWGKEISSPSGVGTTEDQTLTFKSRQPFSARLYCERESKDADCLPLLPITVDFTAPVPWEEAKKVVLRGALKTYAPVVPDGKPDYVSSISFKGPFPENMPFLIEMPPAIRDDAGRDLSNRDKFPLKVMTGGYPPLAKFAADFGIIERDDPYLPVTVRNIESEIRTRMIEIRSERGVADEAIERFQGAALKAAKALEKVIPETGKEIRGMLRAKIEQVESDTAILRRLSQVHSAHRETSILKADSKAIQIDFPRPDGEKPFEVIGIPLKTPGFYVVEIESLLLGKSLLGKPEPMYVAASALVTNLAVHFKWGRENSLVWVTALNNAAPVAGASVNIRDCRGKQYWEGRTGPDGAALVKTPLPSEYDLPRCDNMGGLYVFAHTKDDRSFVSSEWDRGIESWRFQLPPGDYRGPVIVHTILDRPLFRAGEKVHMTHVIRKRTSGGFVLLSHAELPNTLQIEHDGTGMTYSLPLKWDAARGVAESTWEIPGEASLGNYRLNMNSGRKTRWGTEQYQSGTFRVEEFKVPLAKASIQAVSEPVVNREEIAVDLQVSYLSGGGAMGLPVKLRSQAEKKYVGFDDYEGFTFANGEVREGKERSRRGEEYYDYEEDYVPYYGNEVDKEALRRKKLEKNVQTVDLTLGQGGSARAKISGISRKHYPQEVVAELEFKDPNGRIQTVSRRIDVWPSRAITGIRPDSWQPSVESLRFRLAALDLKGRPLAHVAMKAELFQRTRYSHRKRLIGGFYSYENMTETKKIGTICEGRTDSSGILICDVKSPVSGDVLIQAKAVDSDGNISVANQEVWVAGKTDLWFDMKDSDRMDLLPEKKKYEPGEKARFQVRMPFRAATALVTVEREGVLDSYVTKISGRNPVVEVPIKKNYSPNVFVSVLCVRGRIGAPRPTALVDLGKPAYKLGIARINVGWRANELKVRVTSDARVYRVRGKAKVRIAVKRADGKPVRGGEVAVAAVDQGLLELMPNESWKLLEDMMGKRGYEVKTATAQMQVVGKRHFGLKALPQGGGGGRQQMRELFDTLLFWKGRVALDKRGEAEVEIPINDSLTSFRIVAVATAGTGEFGTGGTDIRTSQNLMLQSGLPAVVREGDDFRAGFTVRNASERKMTVEITGSYSGAGKTEKLEKLREDLNAGEAQEVGWFVKVPEGGNSLVWYVSVQEVNGSGRDSLKVKLKIGRATPVRVVQSTLFQLDREHTLEVKKPEDALPGKGGITVSWRPKLADQVGGIEDYMVHYPYTCMEQKVSMAIALKDGSMWQALIREMPSYMDSYGLVKYFPVMTYGSDALTSYILSISDEAGRTIPADLKDRMEKGLAGFIEGRIRRYSALPTADLSIRKLSAAEALSRGKRFNPGLLDSISVEPNLWPTSAVLDWCNILSRTNRIPNRDKRLSEAEQIIRSRLTFQGTTMGFSTEKTDSLWWLMVSGDSNAVRTIISFMNQKSWREDMPRLMRGAMARQYWGHWLTTTANAWGVLALDEFARKFESAPVKGKGNASLGGNDKALDWAEKPQGGTMTFGWPDHAGSLSLRQEGEGRPWVTVSSLAAIPLKEPVSTGYRIIKTVSAVSRKRLDRWSVGDVVRVRLDIDAQSDMTWVVVSDPVPAGATILGTGLGRDSFLLTQGAGGSDWVTPIFEERAFDAFRAYYDYMPKGKWSVEYTMRLNNEGLFRMPETRAEALYSPEMFGELPNRLFKIER